MQWKIAALVVLFYAKGLAQTPFRNISYSMGGAVVMDSPNSYTFRFDTNVGQGIDYAFVTFAPWPAEPYSCKIGFAINPTDGTPVGRTSTTIREMSSIPFLRKHR